MKSRSRFQSFKQVWSGHRRSQGGPKGPWRPKFVENIVSLSFERRFYKQNRVNRLKSNILAPQNFWAGYATGSGS